MEKIHNIEKELKIKGPNQTKNDKKIMIIITIKKSNSKRNKH